MEIITAFLVDYGFFGMFLAAFLAGSVVPLNSELVLVGLLAAGLDASGLLFWATLGNTLGSLFNYGLGMLGKEEWIERFTKVPPEKLEKGKRWVRKYGVWAGAFAWVPVIGELITLGLGFMRINPVASLTLVFLGKFARYWIIISAFSNI